MLLILIGLALIGLTVIDVLWTTLAVGRGGGPITSRLCSGLWKAALSYHRRATSHQFLAIVGYSTILLSTFVWIFLTFVGWLLIFSASSDSVLSSDTNQPADFWGKIYFTGYTLVTLGLGDYRPQGAPWQLATVLAAANGFFLVTLAITYLISVASAVTQKRQLASYISCLGRTPDEILVKAWNGNDFGMLTQHLISLAPMLALHGQSHLAYPVIHYFHSLERQTATEIFIVVLDEALTLLEAGVKPEYQPNPVALYVTRQAISKFLETLTSVKPTTAMPPFPKLEQLRASGIPTVSDEAFQSTVGDMKRRRQQLQTLVKHDGWSWETILNPHL